MTLGVVARLAVAPRMKEALVEHHQTNTPGATRNSCVKVVKRNSQQEVGGQTSCKRSALKGPQSRIIPIGFVEVTSHDGQPCGLKGHGPLKATFEHPSTCSLQGTQMYIDPLASFEFLQPGPVESKPKQSKSNQTKTKQNEPNHSNQPSKQANKQTTHESGNVQPRCFFHFQRNLDRAYQGGPTSPAVGVLVSVSFSACMRGNARE